MIGCNHVRLAFLYVLAAMHMYGNEEYDIEKPSPYHAGPVTPETVIEYGANHCEQRHQNSNCKHYGQRNENLVDKI
jgi:hypothetical protein